MNGHQNGLCYRVELCFFLSQEKFPKMNYSQGIKFVNPQSPHNSQVLLKVFHAQVILEHLLDSG
jgi:hypothetical protein